MTKTKVKKPKLLNAVLSSVEKNAFALRVKKDVLVVVDWVNECPSVTHVVSYVESEANQSNETIQIAFSSALDSLIQEGNSHLVLVPNVPSGVGHFKLDFELSSGGKAKIDVQVTELAKSKASQVFANLQPYAAALQRLAQIGGVHYPEILALQNSYEKLKKHSQNPYDYKVEGVKGNSIEGWLWCPTKPQQRYEIQAWCNGELIGYDIAKRPRDDLQKAKKADGSIAFRIPIGKRFLNAQSYTLQLKIVGKGSVEKGELDLDFQIPELLHFQSKECVPLDPRTYYLLSPKQNQQWAESAINPSQKEATRYALSKVVPKISLHFFNGDKAESKTLVEFGLKASDQHEFFIHKGAELFMLQGAYEKAASMYKEVLKRNRSEVHALMGLGYALLEAGQFDQAGNVFQEAQALQPHNKKPKLSILVAQAKQLIAKHSLVKDKSGSITEPEKIKSLFEELKPYGIESGAPEYLLQLLFNLYDLTLSGQGLGQAFEVKSPEFAQLRKARLLLEWTMK